MMGGSLIKVDNKIFCGNHMIKTLGHSIHAGHIGETAYDKEILMSIA
jgi:hypothetical protein